MFLSLTVDKIILTENIILFKFSFVPLNVLLKIIKSVFVIYEFWNVINSFEHFMSFLNIFCDCLKLKMVSGIYRYFSIV